MAKLWFSAVDNDNGDLVIKLHVCAPPSNKPAILEEAVKLLSLGGKNNFWVLDQDFPEDEIVIGALDVLLRGCGVIKQVSGINWNSDQGHTVNIVVSPD